MSSSEYCVVSIEENMSLEWKLETFYWNFVRSFEETLQVNSDFLRNYPGSERFSKNERELFSKWDQEKDALRDTLTEASYDVFSHYEYQFFTCKSIQEVANLGCVAAIRTYNFLKTNNDEINLSDLVTYIVKGVVYGESPWIMNEDEKNFFSKPGICIEKNNSLTYYKLESKINDKKPSSYRLLFSWEDKSTIKSSYKLITQVTDTYQYIYIKNSKENELKVLRKNITTHKYFITASKTREEIKTREVIKIILKEMELELTNIETVVVEGASEETHISFETLQMKAEDYIYMHERLLCDNMSASTCRQSKNDLIGEHINCIEFANSVTKFCQNDKVSAEDIENILYKVRQAMNPQKLENKASHVLPIKDTIQEPKFNQFACNYNSLKEIINAELSIMKYLDKMSLDNLEPLKKQIEQLINHNTDDKLISLLKSAHTELRKLSRSKEIQKWETELKDIVDPVVSSLVTEVKSELQKLQELIDSDYAKGHIGSARMLEQAETKAKRVITQYIKSILNSDETEEENKIGMERKEEILMSDQVEDSLSFGLEKKLKQFSWNFVRSFEKLLKTYSKNPEANIGVSESNPKMLDLYFDKNKNGLRNTLIEATYDIFSHYEYQFSITDSRIVASLAIGAAYQSFINNHHENENLTTSYIIESVVSEKLKKTERHGPDRLLEFFSYPSIRIVDGKVATDYRKEEYLQERRHTHLESDSWRDGLLHPHIFTSSRLIFPHEDKAIIEATYSMTTRIVNKDYEYKYIKKDKEKQLQILHKFMFIMSKLREPDDIEVEDEGSQIVLKEIELELEQIQTKAVLNVQTLFKGKCTSLVRLIAKAEEYFTIQDILFRPNIQYLINIAEGTKYVSEYRQVKNALIKEHLKEIEFAGLITRFCQNNSIRLDEIDFLLDEVAEARDRLAKKRELFYSMRKAGSDGSLEIQTFSEKTEIRAESPTTALQKECADTSKEFIPTGKAIKEMLINSKQFKSIYDTTTNRCKALTNIMKFLNHVSPAKLSQQLDEDLSKQLHDFKDQVDLLIQHSLDDKEIGVLKRARTEIRKIFRSSEAQYRKKKLEHLNNSTTSSFVKEYEEELRKLEELIDSNYADGNTDLVRKLEQAEAKAIQVVTQYIESEVNKTKNENSSGQGGDISRGAYEEKEVTSMDPDVP